MKFLSRYIFLAAFVITFFSLVGRVSASEGIFELYSETEKDYRCFAASLLMPKGNFEVMVSCRDLIYPSQPEISSYILWANSIDGEKQVKLGDLGIGKAQFSTKTYFDELYVTIERNKRVKQPEGPVVMSGYIQEIDLLEFTPDIQEEDEETIDLTEDGDQVDSEEVVQEDDDQEQLTTRQKLILGFKRAAVVALIALVILIGLIFVITRARR